MIPEMKINQPFLVESRSNHRREINNGTDDFN